jgi:hypothetical protein
MIGCIKNNVFGPVCAPIGTPGASTIPLNNSLVPNFNIAAEREIRNTKCKYQWALLAFTYNHTAIKAPNRDHY